MLAAPIISNLSMLCRRTNGDDFAVRPSSFALGRSAIAVEAAARGDARAARADRPGGVLDGIAAVGGEADAGLLRAIVVGRTADLGGAQILGLLQQLGGRLIEELERLAVLVDPGRPAAPRPA